MPLFKRLGIYFIAPVIDGIMPFPSMQTISGNDIATRTHFVNRVK
jgi:hypothetical protein